MDKKIICFLIMSMFLITTVSAFDFDNVKTYDANTRTATIQNAFGLGDDIAQVKLISPDNVNVGLGYQKVAEFQIIGFIDYKDFIQQINFYDINNGMK